MKLSQRFLIHRPNSPEQPDYLERLHAFALDGKYWTLLACLQDATLERKNSPSSFEKYFLEKSQAIFKDVNADFLDYHHPLHPTGVTFAWLRHHGEIAFKAISTLMQTFESFEGPRVPYRISLADNEYTAHKLIAVSGTLDSAIITPDIWNPIIPDEKTLHFAQRNSIYLQDYETFRRDFEGDIKRFFGEMENDS